MKRELLSKAVSDIDESFIAEAYCQIPEDASGFSERIAYMKKKRIITLALAAALMHALGIGAYAVSSIPRSVGTYPMPQAAEYTSLSELPKVEETVGYPVTVPEHFSNGYAFTSLRVDGQAVFGESNDVLKEYYAVNVEYSKPGSPDLSLHLNPVLDLEGGREAPAPGEQRTVSGVTVDLNLDHYKVVPENYEKTEDDQTLEAAGHYYISFGSDEIKEYDMAFADFRLGDVNYTLMDMEANEDSLDTLMLMASEIISAK